MREHEQPYIVIEQGGGSGLGAFVVGALLGAGVALLLAPRSGEQTREELATGVRRFRDRAQETVRDIQRTVTDTFDDVKVEVGDRIGAARDAFEAGREAARETRRELARKVDETRARVREEGRIANSPVPTDGAAVDDDEITGA